MDENPLKKLDSLGESIWLDYIRRDLITIGVLERYPASSQYGNA